MENPNRETIQVERERQRRRERRRLINAALTAALIILKVTAFIVLPTVLMDEEDAAENEM